MMWLLSRPLVWPVRVAFGTGRLFGYRRVTVFLTGAVVGMLVAPMTGAQLRRQVKSSIEARLGTEPPLDLTGGGSAHG
jgi:hypothetical protein